VKDNRLGNCFLPMPSESVAQDPTPQNLNAPEYWARYFAAPESEEATDVAPEILRRAEAQGVKALFLRGPDYQGRPTRFFAFYGVPEAAKRGSDGWVPGIVLIHGGTGTAYESWVRLWVDRGYAAIAPDTCGAIPVRDQTAGSGQSCWQRLPDGGPPGWGGMEQVVTGRENPEDNWMHQATAINVLAHSWLRTQPEVDAHRIGLTGISWGGVLACRTAGADPRFQFAVPVYGCGFLHEASLRSETLAAMGNLGELWTKLYDPSHLLRWARMPFLWVNGTNDFAFPIASWLKSARTPTGPCRLSMPLRMPHGHGAAGESPGEILAFADSVVRNGKPLAKPGPVTAKSGVARVTWQSEVPIVKAELLFTRDSQSGKPGPEWLWESREGKLADGRNQAEAKIPAGPTQWFFNLTDERGLLVSAFPEFGENSG
jgi:dienelactone hydrolase